MDIDEDLRAAWFIGFAFEADPTFLRAHSLAEAPAPHELVRAGGRVNFSAIARRWVGPGPGRTGELTFL